MDEYKCCFDDSRNCSVRQMWKLKPENLVAFCKICNTKQPQDTQQMMMILTMLANLRKTENEEKTELRQMLMELIKLNTETKQPKAYIPIKTRLALSEEEVVNLLNNAKYWDAENDGECAQCHSLITKGQRTVYILGHPIHANCIVTK